MEKKKTKQCNWKWKPSLKPKKNKKKHYILPSFCKKKQQFMTQPRHSSTLEKKKQQPIIIACTINTSCRTEFIKGEVESEGKWICFSVRLQGCRAELIPEACQATMFLLTNKLSGSIQDHNSTNPNTDSALDGSCLKGEETLRCKITTIAPTFTVSK